MTPYEQQAERLAAFFIAGLKNGTSKLTRLWEGQGQPAVPYNPTTGKPYRGGNHWLLWARQQEIEHAGGDAHDTRWMTYRQARAVGAQVKKGERSTPLVAWVEKGRNPSDAPEAGTEPNRHRRLLCMSFAVFHASQIEGLPPPRIIVDRPLDERIAGALKIATDTGADIRHGGAQAYYSPSQDYVQMPERASFVSDGGYAAVLLHELGHWTGHESRLSRQFRGERADRAREELRAEMSSCLMSERLGVPFDPGEHQAYVNDWIQVLQSDPREILRAAADAQDIARFLNVPEPEYERLPTVSIEHEPEPERAMEIAR